jgi:ribosomal protein L37E
VVWSKCKNCGKEAELHSKELCTTCYKKLLWKPKKGICRRCGREMVLHAKGLCNGCYNFVFHLDKTKERNHQKRNNIDPELYKEITKSCVLCGFDKIVDLHHLDENHKNNSPENLVGLCPNHHKMFHDFKYRKEIQEKLREKGFKVPEDIKIDFEERK